MTGKCVSWSCRGSEVLREVAWVIFDEVHYMQDRDRGVVWEEAIIFLPKGVRMVFLSATLSNASEFAGWVCNLHKQPCHMMYTDFSTHTTHFSSTTTFFEWRLWAVPGKHFISTDTCIPLLSVWLCIVLGECLISICHKQPCHHVHRLQISSPATLCLYQ